VPSVNFTIRSFLVDESLLVAVRSNALDAVAINPVAAGSDRHANLESLLKSRRVNNFLFAPLITTDSRVSTPLDRYRLIFLILVSLNERAP